MTPLWSARHTPDYCCIATKLSRVQFLEHRLDRLAPGGPADYTLDDFRIAMSVQFLFWGLGIVQLIRYRRKSLRHIEEVHPAALDALRSGDTLLPGISRDLET